MDTFILMFVFIGWQPIEGSPKEIQSLFRAWEKRAREIRSVKVTWNEKHTVTKGWFLNADGKFDPEADVATESPVVCILSDKKIRHEFLGSRWSGSDRKVSPNVCIHAFDGDTQVSLRRSGKFPQASIRRDTISEEFKNICNYPLLFFAHPLNISYVEEKSFLSSGKYTRLGERSGVIKVSLEGVEREYWVDGDNNVSRFTYSVNGSMVYGMSIGYEKREDRIVPRQWEITLFDKSGKIGELYNCTVTEFCVNSDLPDDLFRVSLPPGTYVFDERKESAEQLYVTKDNDAVRIVQPHEYSAKYEELVNSESGKAIVGPTDFSGMSPLLFVFVGAFVLFVLGILAVVARNKKMFWFKKGDRA
jgi:hypothetical protein